MALRNKRVEGIEIARFVGEDIAFGKMLTDREGWHRTVPDWNRLLRIEPSGMLKAVSNGEVVGIGGVVSYGKVSWIHSVIVVSAVRGQGIGRVLMEACIAWARAQGSRIVKLDSVHGFEGFYRNLGFVEEFESKRFLRDGGSYPLEADSVRPSDLNDIMAFDAAVFGVNRGRVLQAIYEDAPGLAYVVRSEGAISGYVLGRKGEERVQIGPCVVKDSNPSVARRLITTLVGSNPKDRKFRMCVSGLNREAVMLSQDLGFKSGTSSTRMYLGERFTESGTAFAMISPEKG